MKKLTPHQKKDVNNLGKGTKSKKMIAAAFLLLFAVFFVYRTQSSEVKKVQAVSYEHDLMGDIKAQMAIDKTDGTFIQLKNGSFEDGHSDLPVGAIKMVPSGHPGFYWNTYLLASGEESNVEIQQSSTIGLMPNHGKWYAELDPLAPVAISQDINTTPGTILYWSTYYAKRASGTLEEAGVFFGPKPTSNIPMDNIVKDMYRQNVVAENGNTYSYLGADTTEVMKWKRYSGKYTIPAGQLTTRFQFLSHKTAIYSYGNLLDSIEFATAARVRVYTKYMNNEVAVNDTSKLAVYLVNSGGITANTLSLSVQLPKSVAYTGEAIPAIKEYDENGTAKVTNSSISNVAYNPSTRTLYFDVNQVESMEISELLLPVRATAVDNTKENADNNAVAQVGVTGYTNGTYGSEGVTPVSNASDGMRIVNNMTLKKAVDKSKAAYQEEVKYTVTATNANTYSGISEEIKIEDIIPVGMAYKEDSLVVAGVSQTDDKDSDGAYYDVGTKKVIFEPQDMGRGETIVCSFVATVTAQTFIDVVNKATLSYEWQGDVENIMRTTESNTVTTKIMGSLLLHLRQIVLAPHDDIVVPSTGYFNVSILDSANNPGTQSNSTADSGEGEISYTDFTVNLSDTHRKVGLRPVVPQYYENSGSVTTTTNTPHDSSTRTNTAIVLDSAAAAEYWVTVYLTPSIQTDESAHLYGWDYKTNELGEIGSN